MPSSRALLVALLCATPLAGSAAGACGGTVELDASDDAGAAIPDEGDASATADASTDARAPAAPRCTVARAADPVGATVNPPTLPDGGPGFFSVHPPAELQDLGGPKMKSPHLVPVFFQGDTLADRLEDFVASVGCTDYWRAAVGEYGVGDALAAPAVHLDEAAATKLSDTQIQTWLTAKITAGELEAPVADSIYILFYPETTRVTQGSGASCEQFGGYHNSLEVGNRHVAYAVIPRCPKFAQLPLEAELTGSTSHEIIEAATDPQPETLPGFAYLDDRHLAEAFVLGGESGDLCAQEPSAFFTPDGYPFTVQRNWSNRAAHAGKDPCVPASGSPYFTADIAPTDTIELGGASAGGFVVAAGASRVVDVALYAEDSSKAIEVQAIDVSQALGADGVSSYTLDATSGQSGDVLHLTISTPSGAGATNELFALVLAQGGRRRIAYVGALSH